MLLNPLTFHAPQTLNEAAKLYSSLESAKLQAGGTFLLNALKLQKRKGMKTPEHVISLRKVKDLTGLTLEKERLVIKSMTTITEIFNSDLLKDNFAVLKIVCRNISTQQIRNMATVGGNLTCRYTWTEMPAVMIGLSATLHFLDADGKEEPIAAEDFYKQAAKTNKILSHISIPRDPKARIAYQRVGKTQFIDIPLLSLLINTHKEGTSLKNTRVSINNCVAFAQRDKKLEDFLNNTKISDKLPEEALNHIDTAIYDTRSTDYKKHMFRVAVKNAIAEIIK